jgi:hypothetical protein
VGIEHDGHASHSRHIERCHQNASAERGGLLGGRVHVFTGDIGEPVGGQTGLGAFHHSSDQRAALSEQGVSLAVTAETFGGPFKESSLKCAGGGFIRGNQFIPTDQAGLEAFVLKSSHASFHSISSTACAEPNGLDKGHSVRCLNVSSS